MLVQGTGMKIAIHVDAAKRPFNRVNQAVLIAIQLLEMVMSEFRRLRAAYGGGVVVRARIITLRVFEHAKVDQVRPRPHNGFGRDFFSNLHLQSTLGWHWLKLCRRGLLRRLLNGFGGSLGSR